MQDKNYIEEEVDPQEIQQDYNTGMTPPQYFSDGSEAGIIKELSPKKVLEQIYMKLKGYEYDYEKQDYFKIAEPLMNDKGISKYISILGSVISDIVTFSNYKADEINNLTLYVCEKAIPTIHINYQEYGIKDKSDLQIIDIQIFNLTLAAFKKAMGAGDRNVVRGTFELPRDPYQQRNENNRPSFLGGFFGGRRR
jgi:hypothetical protein